MKKLVAHFLCILAGLTFWLIVAVVWFFTDDVRVWLKNTAFALKFEHNLATLNLPADEKELRLRRGIADYIHLGDLRVTPGLMGYRYLDLSADLAEGVTDYSIDTSQEYPQPPERLPVSYEAVRFILEVGTLSQSANQCGLVWDKTIYLPVMQHLRHGLGYDETQMHAFGFLHGYSMSDFTAELAEFACDESFVAAIEAEVAELKQLKLIK